MLILRLPFFHHLPTHRHMHTSPRTMTLSSSLGLRNWVSCLRKFMQKPHTNWNIWGMRQSAWIFSFFITTKYASFRRLPDSRIAFTHFLLDGISSVTTKSNAFAKMVSHLWECNFENEVRLSGFSNQFIFVFLPQFNDDGYEINKQMTHIKCLRFLRA